MYFGIDSSATGTGVAVVWLKDDKPVLQATKVIHVDGTGIDRAVKIADQVLSFIELNHHNGLRPQVCMEGYSFGSKFQLPTLVEVGTITRYAILKSGYKLLLASPGCLKKAVTGSGSAKKPVMILEAYKKWGFELPDDNQCDAACLAVMCATYWGAYKNCGHDMRKAVGMASLCN